MSTVEQLSSAIQTGNAAAAAAATRALIDEGSAPGTILDGALLPAMNVVGVRFRDREIFLPDVLLAARAMKAAMAVLEPLLLRAGVARAGVVVLGTVHGDLHDIGKNLVSVMLQGAGFEVVDLGADVDADHFIDAAIHAGAAVIGLSALLTTTMTEMGTVVQRIRERGLGDRLRVLVGGAPVTDSFAKEIGADAFAPDATAAVDQVRNLVRR